MGESQSFEMKAGLLVLLLSVAGLQNVDAAGFVLSTEDPSKPGGWDAAMGWMVCPANHHVVDTHSECITAAADLGIGCGSEPEDLANWPKGCYVKPDGDYNVVMFNAHTTGGTANNDAAPICVPDAASFVLGTPDTLAGCPVGHAFVNTKAECETAADTLSTGYVAEGIDYFYEVSEDYNLKGCFKSLSNGYVYFNTHQTGLAQPSSTQQPICVADATTSEETLTCQDIKTEYKQSCCGNPAETLFVVPTIAGSRRLQSTSPSHGGRYGPHQAVDQVVEEFTNWNTLLNQGLINVQEYSARKTRLLESLV